MKHLGRERHGDGELIMRPGTTVKSKVVANIKGFLYQQIMRLVFIDNMLF